MARKFLTHVDMTGNQLLNVTLEKLSSAPGSGNFEGRMYYNTSDDLIYVYNGTSWTAVGSVLSVTGTANEVEVSASTGSVQIGLPSNIDVNSATATKLATSRTIALGGDLSGSASFDGSASVTITADIQPNSVVLGTDTTGNYVADVSASTGISVSGTGESASVVITNTDKGSDQNIFKNIIVGATTVVADSNNDTLTIVGSNGVGAIANATTDVIEIYNTGVTSISGTANQINASGSTGSVTLSIPNAVTFPGTVTLNADPTQALQAATKQYVDAVAEGLHIHASVETATTASVDLSSPPAAIDGVTLANNMRVLVKNQSTTSQNGIYVYNSASAILERASDFNSSSEIQGGDFVFVTGGSTYDNSGWVQTEKVTTVGTDPILFTQFSGAGTYLAGNGLTLTGNTFSINTGVTVDLSTAQTLTNKTLTSPVVSGLYLSDNNIIVEGTNDIHETTLVFTDPTQDNTITFKNASGTVAFTSDIPSDLARKFSANVGNGSATSFSVNHNLGSRDVVVNVYDNATYDTVETDVVRTDSNNVTVSFSAVPSNNAYRVVIIG